MDKTFTLDELAALAGVPREQVLEWEAKGWLGEIAHVPVGDDGKRMPVYGFEQAEACVQLGGRVIPRRVCVVNQKGGVGKTTTALTLAAALADMGRRVLVVDLDAQANLTTSFGFDPDELDLTSADLLTEEEVLPEDVILETAIQGIHAIPGDIKLCAVETRIQDALMRERILHSKLEPLFDRYHVILFDCPPNLSRITINALVASREVVVPVETQSYSIKAISDLTNTFALLKQKMHHDLQVWILPTKVDRRMKLAGDILDALDEGFRGQILDPIHVDSNLIRAPLLCEPVTRAFPASRASLEYARLARFLVLPDAERKQWMDLPLAVRRRVIERAERGEKDLGLPSEEEDTEPAPPSKRRKKGVSAPA
jgi:chromosome partitioning protein